MLERCLIKEHFAGNAVVVWSGGVPHNAMLCMQVTSHPCTHRQGLINNHCSLRFSKCIAAQARAVELSTQTICTKHWMALLIQTRMQKVQLTANVLGFRALQDILAQQPMLLLLQCVTQCCQLRSRWR